MLASWLRSKQRRDTVVILSLCAVTAMVMFFLSGDDHGERAPRPGSVAPERHVPNHRSGKKPGNGPEGPSGDPNPEVVERAAEGVLVGRVIDASTGEPIEGAAVELVDFGSVDSVLEALATSQVVAEATSNEDGSFRLERPEGGSGVSLRAKKPGYVPAYLSAPHGAAAALVLELQEAASISGVVVDENGKRVQGALVRAWDAQGTSPFDQSRGPISFARTLRHARHALTDADGRFEIESVAHGTAYRLVASSKYRVLGKPFFETSTEAKPVRLELHPIYLLWVEIQEPDGSSIVIDPRVNSLSFSALAVTYPSGLPFPISDRSWRLRRSRLSFPEGVVGRRFDMHQVVQWFVLGSGEKRLGPYIVRAELPGYASTRGSFWARRLDDIRQPDLLTVARTAREFGKLKVGFDIPAQSRTRFPTEVAMLVLNRRDRPELNEGIRFEINQVPSTPILFESIPTGQYSVAVKSTIPGFGVDVEHVRIDGATIPEMRITVPMLKLPRVEVRTDPPADILKLLDLAVVDFKRVDPAKPPVTATKMLDDYAISNLVLPAGVYEVSVRSGYPDYLEFQSKPMKWDSGSDPEDIQLHATGIKRLK